MNNFWQRIQRGIAAFKKAVFNPEGAVDLEANQQSIAAKEVKESVLITGNRNQYVENLNYNPGPSIEQTEEKKGQELQAAEQRYLEKLRKQCNLLPTGALGGEEGSGEEVHLDDLYVELETKTMVPLTPEQGEKNSKHEMESREQKTRPLRALEAAVASDRLALLGAPGSGKSVFVKQLIGGLALRRQGERPVSLDWPGAVPLPFFIVLREMASVLKSVVLPDEPLKKTEILAKLFQDHLMQQLVANNDTVLAAHLETILEQGEVLLVLDGLDELPDQVRPKVRELVTAIRQQSLGTPRIVVTCRIRSYDGKAVLPGFDAHELAPFDQKKIGAFAENWYMAQASRRVNRFPKQIASLKAKDLKDAALAKELREVAENPMLLTVMAIIHQREIGLPKERVQLYKQGVDVLLTRWQSHKGLGAVSPELRSLLANSEKLWTVMEDIAYQVHAQEAEGVTGGLERKELIVKLEHPDYLADGGLALDFLDYVDHRAGILVGQGGGEGEKPQVYGFPHRTFQEYLAGCRMIRKRSPHRQYWKLAGQGDFWALAALLGAEELRFNRRSLPATLDLAYGLLNYRDMASEQGLRVSLWSGRIAAMLGVDTVAADHDSDKGGREFLGRLRTRLLDCMREGGLMAQERAEAGRALAMVGDSRLSVLDPFLMEFVPVEAGVFLMGSKEEKHDFLNNGFPQFKYDIPYPYSIARYPVTNRQYQVFVEDGGYRTERFWQEAKAVGHWQDGKVKGYGVEKSDLTDYGTPFNLPNHPAVGLTWWEALAFTRWLNEQRQRIIALPKDWMIRLPSEAEWEKAARGVDGRLYPWVGQPDSEKANYRDSHVGFTNAVGCFPAGKSPYQAEEMSGNVWEWCASQWRDSYKNYLKQESNDPEGKGRRVLRGGSFFDNGVYVRCAVRDYGDPDGRNFVIGFRVVSSPFTSEP